MDATIVQQNFIYKNRWLPPTCEQWNHIYVPHNVLDAGDTSVNETDKMPYIHHPYHQQTKYISKR